MNALPRRPVRSTRAVAPRYVDYVDIPEVAPEQPYDYPLTPEPVPQVQPYEYPLSPVPFNPEDFQHDIDMLDDDIVALNDGGDHWPLFDIDSD